MQKWSTISIAMSIQSLILGGLRHILYNQENPCLNIAGGPFLHVIPLCLSPYFMSFCAVIKAKILPQNPKKCITFPLQAVKRGHENQDK